MKVYFDDTNDFNKDLENLLKTAKRFDRPIVVVPTEKDVKTIKQNMLNDPSVCHVTFISYDYWLSKKWIADGDYDHIDFFRIDQFFINRSFGVKVGVGTIRRIYKKVENKEEQ